MRHVLADAFAAHTLDHWVEVFSQTDACVSPVVSLTDALEHPHVAARRTVIRRDGVLRPGLAPRFSRTETTLDRPPPRPGEHTAEVLRDFAAIRTQKLEQA
jgi:alpha-methylacyl-CoA racemase